MTCCSGSDWVSAGAQLVRVPTTEQRCLISQYISDEVGQVQRIRAALGDRQTVEHDDGGFVPCRGQDTPELHVRIHRWDVVDREDHGVQFAIDSQPDVGQEECRHAGELLCTGANGWDGCVEEQRAATVTVMAARQGHDRESRPSSAIGQGTFERSAPHWVDCLTCQEYVCVQRPGAASLPDSR